MDAQSARVQLAGYHTGEIEVQRRAGVQQKAHSIQGLFATRPVSEQLQSFFGTQRFLYTATRSFLAVISSHSSGLNTCTRANSVCKLTHDTAHAILVQYNLLNTHDHLYTCVLDWKS